MFRIAELPLLAGRIGICPMPGRFSRFADDMATILAWHPALVLTLTSEIELESADAERLPAALAEAGALWRHLPVSDFRAPCAETEALWSKASAEARAVLAEGGSVLAHCYGGCGRSGMALMRLMVDAGEAPEAALERLRSARPCAVETAAQFAWARAGQSLPEAEVEPSRRATA